MKSYDFDLDKYALDKFFRPIRDKVGVIEILMESIKYMILNPNIASEDINGKMILKIDKMSRLFFFKEDKYFSITFPFFIKKDEDGKYIIYSKDVESIDNKLTSEILEIINCDKFKADCSLEFIEPIDEYEYHNKFFWVFLRELFLMEDGYIRYDYDEENYNKFKEKGEIHKHPLNHYDLFYSSNCTFKLGLHKAIKEKEEDFIDLLNISTNCRYLANQ